MKKQILIPGLALALGAIGFSLRRVELATAFEATGLPIPGAPMTTALILLSAAAVALFSLVSFRLCRGKARSGYYQAFGCTNPMFITVQVAAAMLLLGGGALGILAYVNHEAAQLSYALVAVTTLAAGVCVLLSGKNLYRAQGDGRFSGLLLVPAFTVCLWLVNVYQVRAGDPIVLDYVYQVLAIIATLLCLYFTAGYSFEKGRPAPMLWACCLSVFFSCVTLADAHDWMNLCLHAFGVIYGLLYAVILLGNLTEEREDSTDE